MKQIKNVFLPDTMTMFEKDDTVVFYDRETGRVVKTFKKAELAVDNELFSEEDQND